MSWEFSAKETFSFFLLGEEAFGRGLNLLLGSFCFRGDYASLGIFRQASDIHLSIPLRSLEANLFSRGLMLDMVSFLLELRYIVFPKQTIERVPSYNFC